MEQNELHSIFYEIMLFIMQLIPVGVTIAFLWKIIKDLFNDKRR